MTTAFRTLLTISFLAAAISWGPLPPAAAADGAANEARSLEKKLQEVFSDLEATREQLEADSREVAAERRFRHSGGPLQHAEGEALRSIHWFKQYFPRDPVIANIPAASLTAPRRLFQFETEETVRTASSAVFSEKDRVTVDLYPDETHLDEWRGGRGLSLEKVRLSFKVNA